MRHAGKEPFPPIYVDSKVEGEVNCTFLYNTLTILHHSYKGTLYRNFNWQLKRSSKKFTNYGKENKLKMPKEKQEKKNSLITDLKI